MIDKSNNILSKLALYEAIYASNEPNNKRTLAYRVHNLVGQLIKAQFSNIFELSDLILLNGEMDRLIREIKVTFDMIYIDLNDSAYPIFIEKFQSLKHSWQLEKYNSFVIELLKLIFFRISGSSNQDEIEKKLLSLLTEKINEISPSTSVKVCFKDGTERSEKNITNEIEDYIKRQIDISLDN